MRGWGSRKHKHLKIIIMYNYIEPIREELETAMNEHCVVFKAIGSPHETPRYYNFGSHDKENNTLRIESSQTKSLFFIVNLPNDYPKHILVADFWQQFKVFRSQYLKENHPTISTL